MTTEQALNEIYKGLLGEQSLLVKLRNKEGLDENIFSSILNAVETLKNEYKDTEYIPKKLALAFLDISNYFTFSDDWYSEEDQERIEDAGHQLVQAADELFS